MTAPSPQTANDATVTPRQLMVFSDSVGKRMNAAFKNSWSEFSRVVLKT